MTVDEKEKEKLSWEKYVIRNNPEILSTILKDVHEIKMRKQRAWFKINNILGKAIKPVIDKHGVTGIQRLAYYDFCRSLWKLLSKYPESTWDKLIEADISYYTDIHGANRKVLEEVATTTIDTMKKIFRGEVEIENGSKEAGNSDT